jgi:two-component sensor histidine kinase
VVSIALVHETLSATAQDLVQFDEVITKIIQGASELNIRPNEIQIKKVGEFGLISSMVATPLALVLTELIHNALEHGLSQSGDLVELRIDRSGKSMTVTVEDNGAGIPSDFSLESNTNLGLQIVQTLTKNELAGKIEFIKPNIGTQVQISFPLER